MGNLDQVMQKLKKSKKSKIEDAPEEVESEVEEEDPEELEEDEEAKEDAEEEAEDEEPEEVLVKKVVKKKKVAPQPTEEEMAKLKMQEVELLQNDGLFRAELLQRLNEICEIPKQIYILNSLLNKLVNGEEDGSSK